ncbi:MAG: hypothetical protein ACREJQ_04250, partial [bacterium]
FAHARGLPDADAAEADLNRRLERQKRIFPETSASLEGGFEELRKSAEEYTDEWNNLVTRQRFPSERVGGVSGRIEFAPGTLQLGTDLTLIWVSLAPILDFVNLSLSNDGVKRTHGSYRFVTHFPLNSDGSFTLTGLPYWTYRLSVNIPRDILAQPWNVSPAEIPADMTLSAQNPTIEMGTIRFSRSVHILSPEFNWRVKAPPFDLRWEPYPDATAYNIRFCDYGNAGPMQVFGDDPDHGIAPFPPSFSSSVQCTMTTSGPLAPRIVHGTSIHFHEVKGNFMVIIQALDSNGRPLSSTIPLFFPAT